MISKKEREKLEFSFSPLRGGLGKSGLREEQLNVRSSKATKPWRFPAGGAHPDVIGRRVEPLVAMMDA